MCVCVFLSERMRGWCGVCVCVCVCVGDSRCSSHQVESTVAASLFLPTYLYANALLCGMFYNLHNHIINVCVCVGSTSSV